MREPVVGDLGTGPAFVSNPSKTKEESNQSERVTALRAEFVITPGNEKKVREAIELILGNSFSRDPQFLQALVLVSEMEARLMTVLTFWHSNGFAEARDRRIARMQEKLHPFLDQSMRVQSFAARVIEGGAALATNDLAATEQDFSGRATAIPVA